MTVHAKLAKVQAILKAPKDKWNSFGMYSYRSAEGILMAAKPLCIENGLLLTCTDDVVMVGERIYVKATASVMDIESGEVISTNGFACEPDSKKGMDASQITGTASSYARKYALNGLLSIDDSKDADTDEFTREKEAKKNKAEAEAIAMREEFDALVKKIAEKAKELTIGNSVVSRIIKGKYKKQNSKALSIDECNDLLENLEEYASEYKE